MKLFNSSNSRTEEYAQVIDWKPIWSTGAPLPQVFSNGRKVFLIYLIQESDPNWDGTDINVIDNASDISYQLALIEFDGHTFRFGIANDEVFGGLPLYNKGLDYYAAHTIRNSKWIKELKDIHKIHPCYNEKEWDELQHFTLLFHDEILEVIAKGFKIECFNTTFKQLAVEVATRMNT